MELKVAFIGFGHVAREFARLLESRKALLREEHGLTWRTTGIATRRHGCIISSANVDLNEALQCVEDGKRLVNLQGATEAQDAYQVIQTCEADIIFETTPLNPMDGEPAATYIRLALEHRLNVITANKGPIACVYSELKSLAAKHQVHFCFEGAVMDGTPIFNLRQYCLPAIQVLGFAGVFNSTTNFILSGMETGRSFAECLEEAKRLGIAEANSDYDIDGWDAAVKTVALANVFLNADLHPREVAPCGIRHLTTKAIQMARRQGQAIRLIGRAQSDGEKVKITVAPEAVDADSLFATLRDTSSALTLKTDLMGELSIVEHSPLLTQTAYALLTDMLRIHQELKV